MSVLTAGPSGLVDLAERLSRDIQDGRTARQSFGSKDAAFSWAAGMPMIIARFVSSAVVEGLSFNAVRVSPTGTPGGKVPPGGTKPNAASFVSEQITIPKFAGLATVQTEQTITTEALLAALAHTITTSCLLAYDADCAAALSADAGQAATGTTWQEAILAGIGEVAGAGGAPALLVLSAADYAAAVGAPGVGFALDPTNGVTSLWGLSIVISGAVPAGTAYVLDPAACLSVTPDPAGFSVVDIYSGLATNEVRIAVEAFLGFVVTSPASVAKITGPAPVAAGGGTEYRGDYALGA